MSPRDIAAFFYNELEDITENKEQEKNDQKDVDIDQRQDQDIVGKGKADGVFEELGFEMGEEDNENNNADGQKQFASAFLIFGIDFFFLDSESGHQYLSTAEPG
jgi:hypothetical protein